MFGVGYWLLIKRCQLVLVKGQTRRITQEWVVAASTLAYIQTPPQPEASGRDPSGAITCCLMMEEHVSFPGWDTLSELLVEFTVKPCEGQWRIEHTAKNVGCGGFIVDKRSTFSYVAQANPTISHVHVKTPHLLMHPKSLFARLHCKGIHIWHEESTFECVHDSGVLGWIKYRMVIVSKTDSYTIKL